LALKEPQKLPPALSPDEVKRVLTMATSLKARAVLTLAYGCGLRASEGGCGCEAATSTASRRSSASCRSKGQKDRHVMLPAEVLKLLRQWWKGAADRVRRQPSRQTSLAVSRSQ